MLRLFCSSIHPLYSSTPCFCPLYRTRRCTARFHVPSLGIFLQSLYVQYRHLFSQTSWTTAQPRQGSFKLTILPSRKGTVRRSDGILLAEFSCMVWICQHCGAPFVDSPYRVKSEESGVVFLDLIVCHGCYVQARELGLRAEEIGVRYRSPAETTAAEEKKPTLRR